MNTKTIDEISKKPAGSFKAFVQHKENFLRELEAERLHRKNPQTTHRPNSGRFLN